MGICHMPIFLASKVQQRDNELWTTIYPEYASETVCKHQLPEAWFEFRAANPWRNMAQQKKKTLSPSLSLSLCARLFIWFIQWISTPSALWHDLITGVKVISRRQQRSVQMTQIATCNLDDLLLVNLTSKHASSSLRTPITINWTER